MRLQVEPFSPSDFVELARGGARTPFGGLPSVWVVDKEGDTRLVCWGGRGETRDRGSDPPTFFLLVFKGLQVPFSAWRTFGDAADGDLINYEILHLDIPAELDDPEVRDVIQKALFAHHRGIQKHPVSAVSVVFPAGGS